MEINELKTIWQKYIVKQPLIEQLSKDDIDIAIEKNSNSVISKIRKRLKIKIWIQTGLGIIGLVLGLFLFSAEEETIGLIYSILFSTILALGIHKRIQYRTIVDFQKSSNSLRITLGEITVIMEKVVKAQIYTTVILATFFTFLFSYNRIFKEDSIPFGQQILIVSLIGIVAPILFYFIAKRGQQKMFGNYLQTLKDYSKELDANGEKFSADEENS